MATEEQEQANVKMIRALAEEVFSLGRVELLQEILHSQYQDHSAAEGLRDRDGFRKIVDFAARDAARQIIDAYLSRQHFDDVGGSCPMVTLPGDVARSGKVVKRAFESVFSAMAGLFEETLKREGRADRKRALAIAGICVGGMVVARSVDSTELADTIRAAARKTALELGGWTDDGVSGTRARSSPRAPRRRPRRRSPSKKSTSRG